jgi:N-acetylglucosaminyl-diphospho-decaprenol L-rhamnosyltransferase
VTLSILIISYNTRQLTLDCLASVFNQAQNPDFEVLVVDNASTDGSAAAIAEAFPAVRLWARDDNLGFAGANNFAAQHAQGDWLLLLNPDTVIRGHAIDQLVTFAKTQEARDPQAGIFGGRTIFADQTPNTTSCWHRPTPWGMFCTAAGLTSLARGTAVFDPEFVRLQREGPQRVAIVTGCFFLLRRRVWEQLGGFDPAFFMYGEEADLCLRAQQQGFTCLVDPQATIIHHGGASEKVRADKLVRLFKAKAQLFVRHWSPAAARFGIRMLDLWAFSRMAAFAAAGLLRPNARATYRSWKSVWQRRAQWHVDSMPPGPTAATTPPTQVTQATEATTASGLNG